MFFHSTYNAGSYVTHVGILVSPTQMYHAGNQMCIRDSGKGGSYLETEQFKNICLDFDVFGVDYNDYFCLLYTSL